LLRRGREVSPDPYPAVVVMPEEENRPCNLFTTSATPCKGTDITYEHVLALLWIMQVVFNLKIYVCALTPAHTTDSIPNI
jgi:hypothetical protein